jgi:hypothetical protein
MAVWRGMECLCAWYNNACVLAGGGPRCPAAAGISFCRSAHRGRGREQALHAWASLSLLPW